MIRMAISLGFALTGLSAATAHSDVPAKLDWLTGCWQTKSGQTREVWSMSEHGYYFGYSVVRSGSEVAFFEQMRIDPVPQPIFNAYPAGQVPSSFPSVEVSDTHIVFANPDHDYPQKITYARDGDALRAVISKIDDGEPRHFDFQPCPE